MKQNWIDTEYFYIMFKAGNLKQALNCKKPNMV